MLSQRQVSGSRDASQRASSCLGVRGSGRPMSPSSRGGLPPSRASPGRRAAAAAAAAAPAVAATERHLLRGATAAIRFDPKGGTMDRRRFAWALVVFGAALVALSALADALGLGEGGGFGYKQVTGVVVGGGFLAVGLA